MGQKIMYLLCSTKKELLTMLKPVLTDAATIRAALAYLR